MKKHWETKTLGEVCEFRRGLTYTKTDEVTHSKNAVLRANNIDLISGSLNFDEIRYIKDDIDIPRTKKLVKDSVFICTASGSKSHLGKVAFIDTDYDYAFGGFMGLLVPDKDLIEPRYFYNILISHDFRKHVDALTAGANINNLKFSQIEEFRILLPPIAEQKRIVKILDEKFEAIEKLRKITEEQLKKSKELFESRLGEVFETIVLESDSCMMSDIYDVRDGTYDSPKYYKNGYALVTSKNLKEGELLLENVKYISKEDYLSICKRSAVSKGDVLFAMIGTIGNPVVIKNDPNFAIKNVALFKISENQDSNFLRYYLMTRLVIDKMRNEAKGTTQQFVGLGYLRSFPVPKIPLSEQKRVVKELDELSEKTKELEKIFRRKISDLDELKKSYLHEAFSGNL